MLLHFLCALTRFCASSLLFPPGSGAANGDWRNISNRVTRDNDILRHKNAFTTQPWQTGMAEWKTRRGRHFSIHAPLITCWQYFGTGTAPSFSLCHDLAEEKELVFLQFHLPPCSCSISVKSIPLCFPSHLPPLVLFPLLFFLSTVKLFSPSNNPANWIKMR